MAQEKQIPITQYLGSTPADKPDQVAVEEPLEIRVVSGPEEKRRGKSLSITMRTPGNDEELALGFLFSEGLLKQYQDVIKIEFCGPVTGEQQVQNTIRIELAYHAQIDLQRLQRHFYTTSSCGVCGKASLEALHQQKFEKIESELMITADFVASVPEILRQNQDSFLKTGGIHAAGLFNAQRELIALREDVGRHNALDKLVGCQWVADALPASQSVLGVSGRASFELLQKALWAGIPIFVAVGAPSSLAVELAKEFNITLIGFASANRFNVYSHRQRIRD